MKARLLSKWTPIRVIYFVIGSFVIIQSIFEKEWVAAVLGGYIASMGLFAFGCAGGQCFNRNCETKTEPHSISQLK